MSRLIPAQRTGALFVKKVGKQYVVERGAETILIVTADTDDDGLEKVKSTLTDWAINTALREVFGT